MKIAVVRESFPGEKRVALTPAAVVPLVKAGHEVVVEEQAGIAAGYPDAQYGDKGARLASRAECFASGEILLQVRAAGANTKTGAADLPLYRPGQVVIAMCDPLGDRRAAEELAARGVMLFALELVPRITRAQSMDVLSSMATVAGYRAVLLAAVHLPRLFPMMMTAAGTLSAAKVFIVGAGVAGLQAIATSRRLGAIVSAYDVRPAVKEQVQSLGGKFVEMPLDTKQAEGKGGYAQELGEEFYRKQRELMARVVAESDVVITTAAIPGKRSPVLVTAEMVSTMATGSVIVDLAAERGGNCELTKADETVQVHGVTILGPTNLPSEAPYHASQMFAKNITNFLGNLAPKGVLTINMEDEIIRETLVARDGKIVHPRLIEQPAGGGS